MLNSHNFEPVYKDLGISLDSLGCVMANVQPTENMLRSQVSENDLYYSRNRRPWINGWVVSKTGHVTLLYGLLEKAYKMENHVKAVMDGWSMETVEIEDIGHFESPYKNEEYYCIVANVKKTKKLLEAHHRLEFLPHINTFMDYHPHITLCYIKKNNIVLQKTLKELDKLFSGLAIKVEPELNLGESY